MKANTRYHLLQVQPGSALASTVPANQLLKIKLEVDTVPPGEFDTEVVPVLEPIPFSVRTLSLPDLFAGKMHCVLFRRWKSRVKGRDWYDLIWFSRKRVPLHLAHLEERMRQSGDWREERQFAIEDLLRLYDQRVDQVDFSNAADGPPLSAYRAAVVGPRKISYFAESLVRPHKCLKYCTGSDIYI